MAPPFLLTLAAVLLLLPAAEVAAAAAPPAPFDIVKILSGFPEFSNFTCMLVDTGVARSINFQKKVTVLAANNSGLPTAALRRLPHPLLGDLLSLHVVLDFLDPEKLDALRLGRTGKGSKVTTLLPGDEMKLLRVSGGEKSPITFSYAGPTGTGPPPRNATLLRVVTAQAFSVMVLQVSGLVLPGMMPATVASPFDVTKILSSYPEYSGFSNLLTQTGLARAINQHPIVTILAVNNTALSDELRGLPRLPLPALTDLLALHAVLDFLDQERLDALRRGRTGDGSIVTTMLQGTGAGARGRGAGFVRVSGGEDGRIAFSSGAPGGGVRRNATLVKVVTSQAFSVLVLQVSDLILPPGMAAPAPGPQRPRARHMSLPPTPAPAPMQLVPSPGMPEPEPEVPGNTPPPSAIIPIPSVHGGVAAKIPEAAAGRGAVGSWWSGAGAALGIMACLLGRL
ncbi:fasciclin-like arabinogalactan protein 2 [Hordeum vulgare]|nr:fasciclin-like arabinogalactan protein 2 [Hordeum vulgare]